MILKRKAAKTTNLRASICAGAVAPYMIEGQEVRDVLLDMPVMRVKP